MTEPLDGLSERKKLTALASALKDVHNDLGKLPKIFRLDDRYLGTPLAHMNEELRESRVLFVKSPKGTGKTQWLAAYLKSLPASWRVLQLGHRRSLATVLSDALNLTCYLDEKKPTDRYAVSMDSLFFITEAYRYDVLVIDEVEQVLRHFLAETVEKKRNLIFKILIRLLRSAKQVICLDADLTYELTIYLIAKLMGDLDAGSSTAIINEWKTDRSIELYESRDHLIAELIAAIEAGEKVYIPINKLELAKKIESLLSYVHDKDGKPVKVLALNGGTNDERRHKAFFKNPSSEAQKYQVLIATSTLSTGVSIDARWFDSVYGIFDHGVYSYQDCDQAISRVRKCNTVKVWIHDSKKGVLQTESTIRSGPALRELETRNLSLETDNTSLSEGEILYLDFITRIQWCEQNWKNNRFRQFVNLKKSEGWNMKLVPLDVEVKNAGAEMLKIAADPLGNKKYLKILEAPGLSGAELEELRELPNGKLTQTEKRSITKSVIANLYGLANVNELTLKQIEAYFKNNIRNVLKDINLLRQSRADALQFDRAERESKWTNQAFPEYKHNTRRRDLLLGAVQAVGINVGQVLKNAAQHKRVEIEYEAAMVGHSAKSRPGRAASKSRKEKLDELYWVVTQQQIDCGALYAASNLQDLNRFLGTNFRSPQSPEAKVKVFNTMLGQVGVCIKNKRIMKDGVTFSEYCVDYQRVSELAAAIDFSDYPDLLAA